MTINPIHDNHKLSSINPNDRAQPTSSQLTNVKNASRRCTRRKSKKSLTSSTRKYRRLSAERRGNGVSALLVDYVQINADISRTATSIHSQSSQEWKKTTQTSSEELLRYSRNIEFAKCFLSGLLVGAQAYYQNRPRIPSAAFDILRQSSSEGLRSYHEVQKQNIQVEMTIKRDRTEFAKEEKTALTQQTDEALRQHTQHLEKRLRYFYLTRS